jgi:hypothetical protein
LLEYDPARLLVGQWRMPPAVRGAAVAVLAGLPTAISGGSSSAMPSRCRTISASAHDIARNLRCQPLLDRAANITPAKSAVQALDRGTTRPGKNLQL